MRDIAGTLRHRHDFDGTLRIYSHSRTRLPAFAGLAAQAGTRLGWVNALAAIKGGQASAKLPVELGQLGGARGVVFLQKPKGFADDFTRRVVASGSDFGANEFFQFRGERYVHKEVLFDFNLQAIAKIVNVCY
jgi:hypothetical protein